MNDIPEERLTARILALFKDRSELEYSQIAELLPDSGADEIKGALFRLRGKGGIKRLRVKRYVKIQGRAGLEVPILELGSHPDVEKTVDNIEINDEIIRRAANVRSKREEHRYKKEMAALEW